MSRCQLTLVAKILHNIWYNHDAFEKTLVLITYAGTYTVTPPISRDNAYSIYTLRHFNIYIYIYYITIIVAHIVRHVLLLATHDSYYSSLLQISHLFFTIYYTCHINDVFDMIIYNVDDIKVSCSELCSIHCSIAALTKLFVNST